MPLPNLPGGVVYGAPPPAAKPEPSGVEKFLAVLGGAALGYLIYKALSPSGEEQWHCTNCGAFVSKDQARCSKCGVRLR